MEPRFRLPTTRPHRLVVTGSDAFFRAGIIVSLRIVAFVLHRSLDRSHAIAQPSFFLQTASCRWHVRYAFVILQECHRSGRRSMVLHAPVAFLGDGVDAVRMRVHAHGSGHNTCWAQWTYSFGMVSGDNLLDSVRSRVAPPTAIVWYGPGVSNQRT